ncbi:hypothetical protein KUCAC02_029234, partial [Chaenocephalus aceratus]
HATISSSSCLGYLVELETRCAHQGWQGVRRCAPERQTDEERGNLSTLALPWAPRAAIDLISFSHFNMSWVRGCQSCVSWSLN